MASQLSTGTLIFVTEPTCFQCGGLLPESARSDARFCGSACRQAAYRERHRERMEATSPENLAAALRFAEANLSPDAVTLTRHVVADLAASRVTASQRGSRNA